MTYKLPDAEIMRERLDSFNSDPYTIKNLHEPFVEDHAGKKITPLGFVMMWQLAASSFVRECDLPLTIQTALDISAHVYARKLIDDPVFLDQVYRFMSAMGLPIKD